MGRATPDLTLTDLAPVEPLYADGVTQVYASGSNLWMSLYVDRINASGELERVVVHRLVVPLKSIPDGIIKAYKQLPPEERARLLSLGMQSH